MSNHLRAEKCVHLINNLLDMVTCVMENTRFFCLFRSIGGRSAPSPRLRGCVSDRGTPGVCLSRPHPM